MCGKQSGCLAASTSGSRLRSKLSRRIVRKSSPLFWLKHFSKQPIAANAMAAIGCFEKCFNQNSGEDLRTMRLLSFERNLDPLVLAAKHPDCLPHMRHGAPSKILTHGSWQHASGLLQWKLLKGDFRDYI